MERTACLLEKTVIKTCHWLHEEIKARPALTPKPEGKHGNFSSGHSPLGEKRNSVATASLSYSVTAERAS